MTVRRLDALEKKVNRSKKGLSGVTVVIYNLDGSVTVNFWERPSARLQRYRNATKTFQKEREARTFIEAQKLSKAPVIIIDV